MKEKEDLKENIILITSSDKSTNKELIKEEKISRDEYEKLLLIERDDMDEKTHLQKIFKRLGTELETTKKKKLGKIYKKHLNEEEVTNRKIKNDIGRCAINFMFQIFLPLIEIINLIGIFAIISVLNCCFDLLMNSIKSFIGLDGQYHLNFYKELYEQCKNESIDFDIMFFMGFLGDILLKSSGFVASSILFLIINFGSFFMIVSFDFKNNIEKENIEEGEEQEIELYNFFNIIYIFIFYVLLFIGVGASSMLSQQILIDSYDKLKSYYKKKEKMRKLKLKKIEEGKIQDLGNKLLDDKEENYEEKEDDENNEENEEESDSDSDDSIEEEKKDEKEKCDKKKKEEKQEDKKDKDEKGGNEEKKKPNKRKTEGLFDYFFLICITTIIGFFGKYYLCNILGYQIFNKDNMKNYKYFYYYIMIIYVSSIIVSLLLYGLFSFMFIPKKKKKEDKKDQYSLYQIFGFTIYKESLSTTNEQEHNNLCLCCESIRDCCDYILCYTNCTSCIFCETYKKEQLKCCCCCCPNYREEDYKNNKFLFCFCYEGRRKQKWFHSFLVNKTQEALIPYMTQYFFLQLLVIGFEKAYNERESSDIFDDNLNSLKVFIITFCIFFYITITFSFFHREKTKEGIDEEKTEEKKEEEKKVEEKTEDQKENTEGIVENKEDEEKEKDEESEGMLKIFRFFNSDETKTSALSQNILGGTVGILLVNGLYVFILSSKYLANKFEDNEKLEEEMKNDYFTAVPVLLNKFYYFTLIYFCLSYSERKQGLELISGETLISLYISAFDIIISLILYISTNGLIIIQLICSCFISLFWLIMILGLIVVSINEKTYMFAIRSLCIFLCRFFMICLALLFADENRNCCCECCDNIDTDENKIEENKEEKENKEEEKKEKEEIKIEEEKQEK